MLYEINSPIRYTPYSLQLSIKIKISGSKEGKIIEG